MKLSAAQPNTTVATASGITRQLLYARDGLEFYELDDPEAPATRWLGRCVRHDFEETFMLYRVGLEEVRERTLCPRCALEVESPFPAPHNPPVLPATSLEVGAYNFEIVSESVAASASRTARRDDPSVPPPQLPPPPPPRSPLAVVVAVATPPSESPRRTQPHAGEVIPPPSGTRLRHAPRTAPRTGNRSSKPTPSSTSASVPSVKTPKAPQIKAFVEVLRQRSELRCGGFDPRLYFGGWLLALGGLWFGYYSIAVRSPPLSLPAAAVRHQNNSPDAAAATTSNSAEASDPVKARRQKILDDMRSQAARRATTTVSPTASSSAAAVPGAVPAANPAR